MYGRALITTRKREIVARKKSRLPPRGWIKGAMRNRRNGDMRQRQKQSYNRQKRDRRKRAPSETYARRRNVEITNKSSAGAVGTRCRRRRETPARTACARRPIPREAAPPYIGDMRCLHFMSVVRHFPVMLVISCVRLFSRTFALPRFTHELTLSAPYEKQLKIRCAPRIFSVSKTMSSVAAM